MVQFDKNRRSKKVNDDKFILTFDLILIKTKFKTGNIGNFNGTEFRAMQDGGNPLCLGVFL